MPVVIGRPGSHVGDAPSYSSDYVMTRRDLRHAAAARVVFRISWWWRMVMKLLGGLLGVVCVLGLVMLIRGPEHEFRIMFMAMYALFLLIGLALLMHGPLFVWGNCLGSRLRGILGRKISAEVSGEGIRSEFLGTETWIPWRAFRCSGVTKHGLLLVLEEGQFLWLPAESFTDDGCWQRVRALAADRLRRG